MQNTTCHSKLYKVNQHNEVSCVNLYPSAKPLGVSESHYNMILKRVQNNMAHGSQTAVWDDMKGRYSEAEREAVAIQSTQSTFKRGGKYAFTLAEVLITLGIIGIVAAITMPALIANIQDKVKSARIQNIKQKFSKATDKMLSVSNMNGYASTEAFVNEFQHHLKIAKICDNSHLNECWPVDKVIIDDEGNDWEIVKTKTGKTLKMKNDDSHDWDDTVGIITADGTAMILSYNKKCDIDTSKPVTWSSDSSSSTSCIASVFDWNGAKKPNKLSEDVIAFNAGGLGSGCVVKVNGKCFSSPVSADLLTTSECYALKSKLGIKDCVYYDDRWGGAVKLCGGIQNMPTDADLKKIAEMIYEGKPNINDNYATGNLKYKAGTATALGLPEPYFGIWSADEIMHYTNYAAYGRYYDTNVTINGSYARSMSFMAMCKVD